MQIQRNQQMFNNAESTADFAIGWLTIRYTNKTHAIYTYQITRDLSRFCNRIAHHPIPEIIKAQLMCKTKRGIQRDFRNRVANHLIYKSIQRNKYMPNNIGSTVICS